MTDQNQITEQSPPPALTNPFQTKVTGKGGNVGAIAIEQERAIAEAQGQLILAKRFPRDLTAAHLELMESCRMPSLANVAFYNVPRGGSKVSGPSIRLAEEIARVYGNFEYGHRELSRSADKSEVEVYAWDKEKNNRSIRQITVMHTLDTKDGQRPLRDQKDVDDKIANVASKQVRGRILALLPKWMVESAVEECKRTIAGRNDEPLAQRIRKMVDAFGKYGVKPEQIAEYIGHPVESATQDDFIDLLGVFNAIRDGGKISDYFGLPKGPELAAPASAAPKPAEPQPAASRRGRPAQGTKPDAASEQTAAPAPETKPAPQTAEVPQEQQEAAPTQPQPQPAQSAPEADAGDDNPFDFGE
jgi:hypothetical protein